MQEIPAQRRFVAVDPDDRSISIAQGPVPTAAADELLIKVSAAGLNRADLLQRKGLYPPPEDASPIMGLEVAGEVLAVGTAVSGWRPGDRVCALTHGGGYADYTVAPAGQCLPIPAGFSMEEAAALPEALLTVWHNLFQRCRLQAGENVLIHGGASGIGTLGIAICKALGASVYTTAGSDEKCRALEDMGAQRAINYKTEDFEAGTGGVGAEEPHQRDSRYRRWRLYPEEHQCCRARGTHRLHRLYSRRQGRGQFRPMLMKRLTLTGSTLRAQTFAQKAVMVEEIMERVYPHLENGSVRPVVDRVFPLAEAEQAQDYMASGQHMGKILLRM